MSVTIATSTEKYTSFFAGVSYDPARAPDRQAEQRRFAFAPAHKLTMSKSALVPSRTYPRRELLTATG
ncbi:hypothetical protein FB464_3874 [Subtercola boreus]|nr:hypothetical protein FB464_3874 [Subtercola boreus]